jgi:hypothetical protein
VACSKEEPKADDKKPEATASATKTDTPKTDKSAADIMNASLAEAKAKAAATPQPPATPTPPTPPPTPPPTTTDPLPPEVPIAAGSAAPRPGADLVAGFKVGDRVMAKWTNGSWYPGKIVAINGELYDVNYDDGDKSRGLPLSKIRKKSSSSSGGGSKTTTSGDAPCPGPGLTRRCNGRCVNIQEDDNHCGGCNNRCPSGKHCDGHLFCRDADGNL